MYRTIFWIVIIAIVIIPMAIIDLQLLLMLGAVIFVIVAIFGLATGIVWLYNWAEDKDEDRKWRRRINE